VSWPLFDRIPQLVSDTESVLDRFLDYVSVNHIELYPAQEEAILELYSGKNVILNTPTGSGKSLVATALHFQSISLGNRSIYTCPIKALVNEKFLALCREFGPDHVGMITGDATVNAEAPIICCTAEILANDALRMGSQAKVHDVIMDEFHYYSDRERGMAWQIPLLSLPQSRFLLMSATLGDAEFFETSLTQLNHRETVVIRSSVRPVPLTFEYSEIPIHETVQKLISFSRWPVYLVHFTQRECAEEAQNFLSIDFCTKEEKKIIAQSLESTRFSSPYGKEIQKLLKHGIGIHHAGLLPKYRILVERLAQKGLLKIICGTDTLGVGVNVPIRTVIFTKLCKFNGEKTSILSVRDFHQISGRAGRKGFDDHGYVIAQAPEHVVENIRMEQKACGDVKKIRKLVKRKPPEKGYVPWNQEIFFKLVNGKPESLISRFQVSHSMLLQVLGRTHEDGCRALQKMIRNCHESEASKKKQRKLGFELFRSLVNRKIIELNPLRVNVDLQEDFSLNHDLALYLLDTIQLLDPDSLEYALDLLTLVESILENPDLILRKQLDRVKTEKMDEMKMAGVEYDERIEELEKLEYPKPNRDFIYSTFNEFSAKHPWIGQENIRPKAIAREMFETFQSFPEYIRDYGLQRIEGILLRYLSDVYKVLVQTVPDSAKTDEVQSIIVYLRTMIKQIDSSLLDEWEKMRDPNWVSRELPGDCGETIPKNTLNQNLFGSDIFRNVKAVTILIRNEVFQFVRALAAKDYETALSLVERGSWGIEKLEETFEDYYATNHSRICIDQKARSPKNTLIKTDLEEGYWNVQQILIDPNDNNDWVIHFRIHLERCRSLSLLHLELVGFQNL